MKTVTAWVFWTSLYILGGYYTYRYTRFFRRHPSPVLNIFWPVAIVLDFAVKNEAFKKAEEK